MNSDAEIRNCEFKYKCPKVWDSLAPTDDARIRFCDQCQRPVIFCHTATELQEAIIKNQCVAVQISTPQGSGILIGEACDPKYGVDTDFNKR